MRPSRLAAAALLALAACGPSGPHHSVLVITMDTTRADHIGAYGYPDDVSPRVDALARSGTTFLGAYAPMPQTLPSHVTIFTGLQPRQHGTLENTYTLAPEYETLAESLGTRGYQTGAFVGSLAVERSTGIDQGFDVFDQPPGDWGEDKRGHPPQRTADAVTDAALSWADRLSTNHPYFMWAHYYDPHGDPPDGGFSPPPAHRAAIDRAVVRQQIQSHGGEIEVPLGMTQQQLIGFWQDYAGEIHFADEQIGRLLDGLDERGLLDDTVIVLVGDHGEGLYEHGEKAHGTHLWEEMLRVPFIVVAPDGSHAGERVEGPVILQDVEPTVKRLALGERQERTDADLGLDLWGALEQGALPPRPVFVERPHYDRERILWRGHGTLQYGFLTAVVKGDEKLIRQPDGTVSVYDLARDPGEQHDLAASAPDRDRLEGLLSTWMAAHPTRQPGEDVQLSDERRANLEALGYLEGGR